MIKDLDHMEELSSNVIYLSQVPPKQIEWSEETVLLLI
jgi:hypothetical protein